MPHITEINIRGFNGEFDLHIPFRGKHCILVGPNGIGKSTALQIIAHTLGRKWDLLSDHRFSEISIHWGKKSGVVFRKDCHGESPTKRNSVLARIERSLVNQGDLDNFIAANLSNEDDLRRFSYLGVPRSTIFQFQRHIASAFSGSEAKTRLSDFSNLLNEMSTPKCTFFPTSRRIEIELEKLSKSMPDYVADGFSEFFEERSGDNYFEEIFKFGMEDIERLVRNFESKAQAESRNKFNFLMANLLKEMANERSMSVRELREKDLSEKEIERVLSRIEEGVLSSEERARIVKTVTSMAAPQKGGGNPPFHKKWLSHFFVRLQEVDKELQVIEAPMIRFVNKIKNYLPPKEVRYDIETSRFSVTSNSGREVKLSELSSGEKQLTAILAMLEFSSSVTNVLIDEPELSLSVPWQSTVLEDISSTAQCHQLIAVTHSPFVYDNSLDSCVVDFSDCLTSNG